MLKPESKRKEDHPKPLLRRQASPVQYNAKEVSAPITNQWPTATHNFVHTAEGFRSRRAVALTTRYNDLSLWITTAAISLNAAPALIELATKSTLFTSHVTASCQLEGPLFQQFCSQTESWKSLPISAPLPTPLRGWPDQ